VNAPLEHVAIAAWLYLVVLGTLIAFSAGGPSPDLQRENSRESRVKKTTRPLEKPHFPLGNAFLSQ
jgi:hypothetical protein